MDAAALREHAAELGIELGFTDYRGVFHPTADETLRALVEALGFPTEPAALAAELVRRRFTPGVPPAAVLHEHWPPAVEIVLPERAGPACWRWEIELEDGGRDGGELAGARLEVLERGSGPDGPAVRYRWHFAAVPPLGLHRLRLVDGDGTTVLGPGLLAVAPARAHCPEVDGAAPRQWGLSIQLWGLRSARNWGMGDFTDLAELARRGRAAGADFIGLNPLHALFYAEPAHISPYSPSNRLALNPLYLDVEAMPGAARCRALARYLGRASVQAELARLRHGEWVDHRAVAAHKKRAFAWLWADFTAAGGADLERFESWCAGQGAWLRRHAAYELISEQLYARHGRLLPWQAWPEDLRDPDGPEVARLVARRHDRFRFHCWLQWCAAEQLAAAAAAAAGMRTGLYRDLAVGADPGGAEAWGRAALYGRGARVGAPPDPLALQGQDWGLPPFNPWVLRELGYAPFVDLLRANFAHAGALRIDHVMALQRLWWIPQGLGADQGAYVAYPLHDLLGLLCLESRRAACRVIGEDLGTVPDAIRRALPEAGVYAYRVLYFERDGAAFRRPEEYPVQALATVGTHDLPTFAGWWAGEDIRLRERLGLFPSEALREEEAVRRGADRRALLEWLRDAGAWDGPEDPAALPEAGPALIRAVHRALAGCRSALFAAQPDDLLGMRQPINVPGTVDAYPNWRRKLAVDLERLFEQPTVAETLAEIDAVRRRPPA